MNKFSEADRIEQFEKLMNPYISKEFRNWLISNGFRCFVIILKVNFQNNVRFKLRFKIKSSCSCWNLNRLKAFIYAGFPLAVQVVQDDF